MGWGPRTPLIDGKTFIKIDELDQSYIDALKAGNDTRYLSLTKYTLQKYLEACLDKGGQFRPFFEKFAIFAGEFVVNQNLSEDNTERNLQIARYYSQLKARPPQIFIQDGGYNYTPASLGGLTAGWNERTDEGDQIVRVMDVVPIPIEITFSAVNDEEFIDSMAGFFSAAFGQYQRFLCGYVLSPATSIDGAYWEVRIPLDHSVGTKSNTGLHGDPSDVIWSITCSMTVDFENSSYITYRSAPIGDLAHVDFVVEVPDTVPMGTVIPINLSHMPYPVEIYSSDFRVAIVQLQESSYFIHTKRPGLFKLMITKQAATDETRPTFIEKEIRVTLR